jgi:ParB-like chromosome segregation protein Spo0J
MKLKIWELRSNPFKSYINDGKLNDERLAVMEESIEHGTLPEHFIARRHDGRYELTSGHHRIEALKKKKGKDYEVDVTIVNFSDEQMLVDMVRENITQRDTDFHDKREGIVLARAWLQSGASAVKQFHNIAKGKKGFQPIAQEDSCRSIAQFLSKNGKAVSYRTVCNYIKINDGLSKELLQSVGEDISFKDALALSGIEEEEEQKKLKEIIDDKEISNGEDRMALINLYKTLPDDLQEQVLSNKVDLESIKDVEPKVLSQGEIALQFHRRIGGLVLEMRRLRKGLGQFRKEKLFEQFTPIQRKGFYTTLNGIKKEYTDLMSELDLNLEVLE